MASKNDSNDLDKKETTFNSNIDNEVPSNDHDYNLHLNNNNRQLEIISDNSSQFNSSFQEDKMQESSFNTLRSLKLFPIFKNKELAKISPNYYLYLEFYYVAIRVFFKVLVSFIICYLIFLLLIELDSSWESNEYAVVYNSAFGIFMAYLISFTIEYETKRILENDILYDSQWNEGHFALLAENFPKEYTKQEIEAYFNTEIDKGNFGGNVIDVILIQDYSKYLRIKKDIDIVTKKIEKDHTDETQDNIIRSLEDKLNETRKEYQNLIHFQGKAIMIFDTMRVKDMLLRNFKARSFPKVSIKELPEPKDLIIQNLHCTSAQRRLRKFGSYMLSLLALWGAYYGLTELEKLKVKEETSIFDHTFRSYLMIVVTLISAYVLQKCDLLAQKLLNHSSHLEAEIRHLNFIFILSIVLYVTAHMILGFADLHKSIIQVLRLSCLYGLKIVVKNAFIIYSFVSKLQHTPGKTINNILVKLVKKIQKRFTKFDFIKGIDSVFPLILIGILLVCLNPLVLLPILIGIIYLFIRNHRKI